MRLTKSRKLFLATVAFVILLAPASSLYYEYKSGASCARCHEISRNYEMWQSSSHRGVKCGACHGEALTLDPGFHLGNLRRVVTHIRGNWSDRIRLRNQDLPAMQARCQKCHQQEFAQWQSGPHSVRYSNIFVDPKHNTRRLLMDDCLRCHGMYFNGPIRELVSPVNTTGPWKLIPKELADQPAIPCLSCHQMHLQGRPMGRSSGVVSSRPATQEELYRPSLALYDRRESSNFPVRLLPLPKMLDGDRPVRSSPDQRQALCYQCHAPLASRQVNSGDDRTPMGVHEGLSCLACHQKHGQQTRASCANCHPRLSNCGLDVEKMDTSFLAKTSQHNIHFVKCVDCHEKGVPQRKSRQLAELR